MKKSRILTFALSLLAASAMIGAAGYTPLKAYAQSSETGVTETQQDTDDPDGPEEPEQQFTAPVLSAAAGSREITLSFDKAEGATRYELYRVDPAPEGEETEEAPKTVNTLIFSAEADEQTTSYTYTDTGLDGAAQYTYFVRAYTLNENEEEISADSEQVSAIAGLDKATAKVTAQADGTFTLTVNPVEGADRYRIYRINSDGTKTLAKTLSSTLIYKVTGALGNVTYTYDIEADKKLADGSYAGAVESVTEVFQPLYAPTFTLTSAVKTVKVSWTKSTGAQSYRVYTYDAKTKKYTRIYTADANTFSYKYTSLTPGTKYTFVVRAVSKDSSGYHFDQKMASKKNAYTKLVIPKFSSLTFKGKTVTSKWKTSGDVDGYQVWRTEEGKDSYVKLSNISAAKLSYAAKKGVVLGTTYKYKVRAYKKVDGKWVYSDFSDIKTVTPKVRIVIDPGHVVGGNRAGNEYDNVVGAYSEAKMSTALSHYLRDYLESYGFEVLLTRETERAYELSLEDRGYMAKGYDFFLSLHSNAAANTSLQQPYAFCAVNGSADAVGKLLSEAVASTMGVKNGGVQHRYYPNSNTVDYYCVVRNAVSVGVPAILMEHSYHTNPYSRAWLLKDSNLKKLAKAEAKVLAQYFGAI